MRLTSALILVAIVGFGAYLFVAQPKWFMDFFAKGVNLAEGYPPATTPTEAAESFCKAMNDRNYDSAGLFCKGNYGEALKKANAECIALGQSIDTVRNLAEDKGILNDNTRFILAMLDPSPGDLKVKEVTEPKEGKAKATFEIDLFRWQLSENPVSGFDPAMFKTVLTPASSQVFTVDVLEVGEGEEKQWKLDIPLSEVQRENIDYYMKNYRSYVTALDGLAVHLRASGGVTTKSEMESELKEAMSGAK